MHRWRRRLLVLALVLAALGFGARYAIGRLGGAWAHAPHEMDEGLSDAARAVLDAAFDGVNRERLLDYHVHIAGIGAGGTGAFVNPHMRSWWHLKQRLQFSVYMSASGIDDMENADRQFVERFASLANHGRYLLLAFDKHYDEDGAVDLQGTEFHVPNDYIFELCAKYPKVFVPAASVHPYRADAVDELRRCHAKGARIVKWLPNAMGMDPASARCEPFYAAMKELSMILLSHAGDEKAVESEADQKLGDPRRLRKPLDMGVKVIVAHCASLGDGSFDGFLELMDDEKYEGLVFGEISALAQYNRLAEPLRTMLKRKDLHPRLVNGSDYPLPAINALVRTKTLVKEGFITEAERTAINEIYDYNPLLFDFVLKRTMGFPPSIFEEHPALSATP